ncbi:MAG TPA: OmpA family protein [Gemmatimonadaceae bacterium]|nr:OmpA family protein [Gemmatimonadaceae bacterium]
MPNISTIARIPRTPALLALALLATGACHKKKPVEAAPTPVTRETPPPATDNSAERDRLERERLERERLERERAERERKLAEMRATMTAPIYFGFDRSDLTAEARASLEAKWAILNANPGMRISIEGHTDDAGSDEYNLALGQRRAAAAKRFLVQREVNEGRIEIASFGEERATCQDATEECRARNRRDEFRIVAGEPVASQR